MKQYVYKVVSPFYQYKRSDNKWSFMTLDGYADLVKKRKQASRMYLRYKDLMQRHSGKITRIDQKLYKRRTVLDIIEIDRLENKRTNHERKRDLYKKRMNKQKRKRSKLKKQMQNIDKWHLNQRYVDYEPLSELTKDLIGLNLIKFVRYSKYGEAS